MRLHKQPATQTDHHAQNVRNDQNRDHPLVAMPSIPQQDPSDNTVEPGRRERVSYPARDLVRRQRAVEAARPGHRFFCVGGASTAFFVDRYAPLLDAPQITNFEEWLRRLCERLSALAYYWCVPQKLLDERCGVQVLILGRCA